MEQRFFVIDQSYPAVELLPGQALLMTRGGGWEEVAMADVLADPRAREVSFEAFREVVEGLGGVLPDLF